MTGINLPPLEDLDVDGLASLPKPYRYELHNGSLYVMTPSTFWHQDVSTRLCVMLRGAGLLAYPDPGVRGDRPRDSRLPDVGVLYKRPKDVTTYSFEPGSAYSLVIEIVSENTPNGEYAEKSFWYAQRGIPQYWIVDLTSDRDQDDGVVHMHQLTLTEAGPAYVRHRTVLLTELEKEYRAQDH